MAVQIQESKEEDVLIISPEQRIKELLAKLKKLKVRKDTELAQLIMALIDAQEQLDQAEKPFIDEAEKIEAEIKTLVLVIERPVKTESGMASYRKGSVRVTYDRKALDAIQDQKIREQIDPHRKETESEPSVKIEVY